MVVYNLLDLLPNIVASLLYKIQKTTYAYGGLFLKKRQPVVILSAGRSGTMAMDKSLKEAGEFVFKLASVKERRGNAQFANKYIFKKKKPAKIITLVRDPLAQMVSAFFSKVQRGKYPIDPKIMSEADVPILRNLFIEHYFGTDKHLSFLNWYEKVFQPLTNVDVYNTPFNTNAKTTLIEDSTYPTLILRLDLDNEHKSERVRDFLENPSINIEYSNTRQDKGKEDVYQVFKNSLNLNSEQLDLVYKSRYAQHFFTPDEIDSLKQNWGSST